MTVIRDKISREKVRQSAQASFGDMVKAVVDIKQGSMALGGEWHCEAEAVLLEHGSKQENLWGINIYPDNNDESLIAFVSLINIRPRVGNRSMEIQDLMIREKIKGIVTRLIV
ncbi:MAG: hypothetical protein HYT31_04270 [Parcubacteria group bacterium]|nr:hypothetical protein [Parcubacteria group bacterium]